MSWFRRLLRRARPEPTRPPELEPLLGPLAPRSQHPSANAFREAYALLRESSYTEEHLERARAARKTCQSRKYALCFECSGPLEELEGDIGYACQSCGGMFGKPKPSIRAQVAQRRSTIQLSYSVENGGFYPIALANGMPQDDGTSSTMHAHVNHADGARAIVLQGYSPIPSPAPFDPRTPASTVVAPGRSFETTIDLKQPLRESTAFLSPSSRNCVRVAITELILRIDLVEWPYHQRAESGGFYSVASGDRLQIQTTVALETPVTLFRREDPIARFV